MILSRTLYRRNKNHIFTITHTIFSSIFDVLPVSATKDTIEFNPQITDIENKKLENNIQKEEKIEDNHEIKK